MPSRPDLPPERCVFINCPYDAEFVPLFEAIIFTTVCCGFMPRSAMESGSVAEPRIQRITDALFSSRYSIHDLTRCRGEGDERLARFNMPLELGMAMARRLLERNRAKRHDWLVLVPEGHRYLQFASDLGAYDPAKHNGTLESLVPRVMSWLAGRPGAIRTLTPQDVLDALPRFRDKVGALGVQWRGEVPWDRVVEAATEEAPRL